MTDIRDIAGPLGVQLWHSDPAHPGYAYCFTKTYNPEPRIHIAKRTDHKVLGSFSSFKTANATMQKLYALEREAKRAIA